MKAPEVFGLLQTGAGRDPEGLQKSSGRIWLTPSRHQKEFWKGTGRIEEGFGQSRKPSFVSRLSQPARVALI